MPGPGMAVYYASKHFVSALVARPDGQELKADGPCRRHLAAIPA